MVNTYLGDSELCRTLAGSPELGIDITQGQLDAALEYGHDQLILYTGKTDWNITHPQIDQLKRIEEHFGASWIKSWWRDPDKLSQTIYNRAVAMCNQLMSVQSISNTSLASFTSTAYGYRTPALNPAADRYTSPRVDV